MGKLHKYVRRHAASPACARGFTLIEVITALVMLAAVYMIALPAISRTRVTASLHNARHVVVSSISLARATAIRYGRPTVLRLDEQGDRVWVEADTSAAGTGVIDTLGLYDVGQQFEVDLQTERGALCFNGRGIGTASATCPTGGGLILVVLQGRADSVMVTPVGRVITQ